MSKKHRLERSKSREGQPSLRARVPAREREARRSRNKIAAVLVLSGALVGGFWLAERGNGQGSASESTHVSVPTEPQANPVLATSESVDRANEMAQIELPLVDYRSEAKVWPKERVDSYFLPKEVPAGTVQHFDRVFDHMTGDFLAELEKKKVISDRANFVNYYFTQLFDSAFASGWKKVSLHDVIAQANKLLIPHGYWLGGDRGVNETYNKYILYKIGSVGNLTLHDKDWVFDAPVLELEDPKQILIDPSAQPFDFSAAYWPTGQYMAVDQARVRETLKSVQDFESLRASVGAKPDSERVDAELMRRVALTHEGMHAAMHHRVGKALDTAQAKNLGIVNMGHYALDTARFGPVTNINIGELAANGYGVMHSGEQAAMTLFFIHTSSRTNPTYLFSDFVLLNELHNSPSLDPATKADFLRKVQTNLKDEEFMRFLIKLPSAEVRKIGERMAKLGLYLMEK